VIGAHQADSLKDHTHLYNNPVYSAAQTGDGTPGTTGGEQQRNRQPEHRRGSRDRPRNNAKLACIKF